MDRLRRSLRDSFRRRKDHMPECSKPHQWQADEAAVRSGTCSFQVKYLGCVEVFESRGMQICEEALKVLRNSRRRPIKGTLYVTGDGLRVVDDETKGLIVDQTIEKVSFCAPDRNHEKGFSYICRDGTTRRWMCHGFLALRDSGERLSHAVGCAFAVCLEKKQKRDKETVMMNFDPKTSSFTRTGSFRQGTMTERMQEPQEIKKIEKVELPIQAGEKSENIPEPPPLPSTLTKQVHNPYAIERPHATPMLLQRQGSFRGFAALNQTSPFKRQLSLRINELPSTLERQRAMSLESSDLFSSPNGHSVCTIPESSPVVEKDSLSAMCQQVSQGLSLLSGSQEEEDDAFISPTQNNPNGSNWSHRHANWMGEASLAKSNSNPGDLVLAKPPVAPTTPPVQQPVVPPRRSSPNFSHLRSQSVGSSEAFYRQPTSSSKWLTQHHAVGQPATTTWTNGASTTYNQGTQPGSGQPYRDPFDAEWAASVAAGTARPSTNPFVQSSVKTFEVQM